MKILTFLFLLVLSFASPAQTCEHFDRKLFFAEYIREVTDDINCKDSLGKKQGWWIYYKVDHNDIADPDALDTGNYVEKFTYGKYRDDLKIGIWRTIFNVHLISVMRQDSFYYNKDTVTTFGFSITGDVVRECTRVNKKIYVKMGSEKIICDPINRDEKGACWLFHGDAVFDIFSYSDFGTRYFHYYFCPIEEWFFKE